MASGHRSSKQYSTPCSCQDLVRELGAPDFVVSAMQGRAQEAAIMECLAAESLGSNSKGVHGSAWHKFVVPQIWGAPPNVL